MDKDTANTDFSTARTTACKEKAEFRRRHYAMALAVAWTALVATSIVWTICGQRGTTNEMARSQARAGFDRDILFRRWIAGHGGVYVPITDTTSPNPHLSVPEREIKIPSGRELTLVNPAYMTRQAHELGALENGIQGHITSLKPIRPENAADPWETAALESFEQGNTEYSSIEVFRGEPHLRLMRPLRAEKSCLKCHGSQGYKEGDIHGGISNSVPMAPLRAIGHAAMLSTIAWQGAFWGLGLGGIVFSYRYLVKRARQARESEQRFMDLLYASDDAILLIDGETFVDCNEATSRMLEYSSRGELLMTHPSELSPPEQPDGRGSFEKAREMIQIAFDNGPHRFEWTHRKAGGKDFPVEVTLTPITYHGKTVLHCIWRDLSEQKQAEKERDRSRETVETILESLPVGVVIIGRDKRLRHVNPAALAMMGHDSDQEILGCKCHKVLCPAQEHACPIIDLGKQVENAEKVLIDKDKNRLPVLKTVIPVTINDEDVLLETFVDISECKQVEIDLLRSETRFRTLYELGGEAVMLLDQKGFFDCNDAAVRMFGCKDKTNFCNKHPSDLSPPEQPCGTDSLSLASQRIDTAMKNGVNRFEWVHKRADTGAHFSAEVLLNAMELDGKQVLQAIVRDISDRKRVEQALQTAKEEAETANRAKSQFLASMSHELRTPLTGILGFTDLLLGAGTDEGVRQEYLQTIRSSGSHLLELINDILDLSKIDAGRLEVERAACAPHEILNDIVSIMRAQAQAKNVDLRCRWSGSVPGLVNTDGARLRQILLNLVGNAVKFTQQGAVDVVARLEPSGEGHKLCVDITDSGIGIPEEKLAGVFEPFVQADNSVTREFGGTGLGLAISVRLAQALGGDISVTSELGVGSTFSVCVDAGDLEGVEMMAVPPTDGMSAGQDETHSSGDVRFHAGAVLLVEDGQINRKLISTVLEQAGLSVSTAENGEIGVDLATRNHFDLILMDMQMPVMDGYVATKKLRNLGYATPIIALTAHAMKGDKEKCLTIGCSHYVSKPIDIDTLLVTVAEAIGQEDGPAGDATRATSSGDDLQPLVSTLPTEEPVFREILQEFVEYLDQLLAELRQAAAKKDVVRLGELAHSLKGSAGTAGFEAFTEPARQLETLIKRRRLDAVVPAIAELAKLAKRILVPTETCDAAS